MCKLGSSALTTPMQVMPDPRPPALHEFFESEIGMLILCYSAPKLLYLAFRAPSELVGLGASTVISVT